MRKLERIQRTAAEAGRGSNGVLPRSYKRIEREGSRYGLTDPVEYRARVQGSAPGMYRVKLAVSGQRVRVHCSCDDYAYTFYPALAAKGLAIEEVQRPEPKGTGAARAIPKPGACKHLLALIERAKDDD